MLSRNHGLTSNTPVPNTCFPPSGALSAHRFTRCRHWEVTHAARPTASVASHAIPGWEAVTVSTGTDFSLCLKMSRGFTALCAISDAASCEDEERSQGTAALGSSTRWGAEPTQPPQQGARAPGSVPVLSPLIRFF